jgi:hypothetical protein
MQIKTRVAIGALAVIAVAGGAAGTAAAQAAPHAPAPHARGRLTLVSQLTAIQFFTATGPITGFPTRPLMPGDRIIGQDRIVQNGRTAGHDNEACTVSFGRDVLCQDIVILTGQGDLQTSWTFQWPATGTRGPASFDGVIDGGTAHFAAAHGTFHAATLPSGAMQITAVIDEGQR